MIGPTYTRLLYERWKGEMEIAKLHGSLGNLSEVSTTAAGRYEAARESALIAGRYAAIMHECFRHAIPKPMLG